MAPSGRFFRGDFWTHVSPWEARERRRRGEQPPQFVLDRNEYPYEWADDRFYDWWRVWGVGGKTNIWGRVSLRYSDLNFDEPAKDGWEIDWPFRYNDIAPYYDNVDKLIGVCGDESNEFGWGMGERHDNLLEAAAIGPAPDCGRAGFSEVRNCGPAVPSLFPSAVPGRDLLRARRRGGDGRCV